MDDLDRSIIKGGFFPAPSIAMTIDDGYLDNYVLAYPILRELEIPALIYLTVGFIGTKNGLWLDDVELALVKAGVQSFHFEELFGDELLDISTYGGKKKAEQMLFTRMLKLGNSERNDLIRKLFDILNVEASEIENKPRVMLNWDEILEMSENKISFGAHTLSHPHLPAMTLEAAKHEIENSKKIVEDHLGKSARHFAIPNGKPDDFTIELREFCEKIGFNTIATTESGVIDSTSNRLSLKRVLPPPPLYYFACEIAKCVFFSKSF
jgi:peptidoglycan/xylan/chitin deacetylase (PgdA/CDA1 family)